jgi:BASS family bile acid:Na+ symporter
MDALLGIAAPVTTFTLLMAIGLELTSEDFARIRRQRWLVLVGLVAPLLLLPPLALGLTRLLESPPDITTGIFLIAACPIGSVSNTYCYLARASIALSITLTGLSSLLAGIAIPLAGMVFEAVLSRPFELRVPFGQLALQLLLLLALPVLLGMWLRRRTPALASGFGPRLQRFSVAGILVVLTLVILADAPAFVDELSTTVPLAITFVVGSVVAGWTTAALFTGDSRDRFAIASEFGARNVGVAAAIAVTVLGRFEFARFAAAYALVELPLMLAAVAWFRRSQKPLTMTSVAGISEAHPVTVLAAKLGPEQSRSDGT